MKKTMWVILLISLIAFAYIIQNFNREIIEISIVSKSMYVSSKDNQVQLYDLELKEKIKIPRGLTVNVTQPEIIDEVNYYKIDYENQDYYIKSKNLTTEKIDIVQEKEMYVQTSAILYKEPDSVQIKTQLTKGEKLNIIGHTEIKEDGTVEMYEVTTDDYKGYIYSKYLTTTEQDALLNYNENNNYEIHENRLNTYLGGSGASMDYYPREKPQFENNIMPDDVRTLYMNSGVISKVDEYINLAKETGINAIVVDIKDNTSPAFPAEAMKLYSITNYEKAFNTYESYQEAIQKINDAGLYSIGRITVFKDNYYTNDNPEDSIIDLRTNQPLNHGGSNWPSAFNRNVWEFSVALAIESVVEMGFNEIQFDYVRFPDLTSTLEKAGYLDFLNTYDEDKAEAIQKFLMYATDKIHAENAYVSADVFGEAANTYVTAYGQYWPAISNVVDVISPMPYPDHFNTYEYGLTEPVWTIPYQLLSSWAKSVNDRQKETPTPAKVRTWIQAYNSTKSPYVTYDSYMISEQLKALYEQGLTGGFITWNASSSLTKYNQIKEAFGKEY